MKLTMATYFLIASILMLVGVNVYAVVLFDRRLRWEQEHYADGNISHVFLWSQKEWENIKALLDVHTAKGHEGTRMLHKSADGRRFIFKIVRNYTAPKKQKKAS